MNEMKPEDVMRALEWCSNGYDCKQCFLYGTTRRMESCMAEMMKKALALLREKDAEIERLKKASKNLSELGNGWIVTGYKNIRSEAITEFAERVKYTLCINNEENTDFFDYAYTLETIDQIAKEMKGEVE